MSKEEKIATYTTKKKRIQLLKMTEKKYENVIEEISNSVDGYIATWSDGQEMKIKDQEVEELARIWHLNKQNSNYYIKTRSFEEEYNTRYQIRINRKVVGTYTYESQASRKMASIITSELLQQKFSF